MIEQDIAFWTSIGIIIAKFSLVGYVFYRVAKRPKEEKTMAKPLLWGVILLFSMLGMSRICIVYFDFILTNFDENLYLVGNNFLFWRLGALFIGAGVGGFLLILDLKILDKKFKGIFGFIAIGVAIADMFYPVNTQEDIEIITFFDNITAAIAVVIPILFIWIGRKSAGVIKSTAYIVAIGALLYIAGGILEPTSFPFFEEVFGEEMFLFFEIFHAILKISGLLVITFGARKFTL